MATTKKQAANKDLTVVAIYKFKTNGKLNGTRCTLVRNGEGKEYKVWTHANGCASSCDCEGFQKWHKTCYHVKHVEAREAALKPVVATPAAPVAKKEVPMIVKPTAPELPELTDEELAEMLATCETPHEPTTAQQVVSAETTPSTTKVATPIIARKVSSIEASSPSWMMTGFSKNGTFSGRGTRKAS